MSIFEYSRSPWTARMLSVLRIVTGLMFLTAGTTKLFGFPPSPTPMLPVHLMSQFGLAGMLETIGGTNATGRVNKPSKMHVPPIVSNIPASPNCDIK